MKRRRSSCSLLRTTQPPALVWLSLLWAIACFPITAVQAEGCPPSEAILPCRCSLRGKEIQIWCSHSNLPQIIDGIKAVERNIKSSIDELVLENNQLPALPGRFFGTLQIVRLMLRYNSIERVSNGWLNELENSLVEIYIVEPQLRSIPVESLNGMINLIAITIQSDELKHLPDFSGLLSLTYLSVQSKSLTELQSHWFRHLPKVQNIHINGGPNLNRLETGLFDGLISLKNIDLSRNGINWIHLRALSRLPNLVSLKLSYNEISDVGMIGRIVKDLENLKKLRLDHNIINIVGDGSFVDLPHLSELHLNDNRITELQYGAFLRTPMLKTIYLHNNHIQRIHPESFLQASGSGVEIVYAYNNEIEHVNELRSLLNALPALKFLDMSNNHLRDIPFGALRGHGTLEQLHLNNNQLRTMERDALMAMPALRELRMRNNSLASELPMPFWNLPGLKGLDLAANQFRVVDSFLLAGLPSLRRLDLSENGLAKLDPTTFVHNPMLETLNISANELTVVHHATFRQLDRLFEVDASHNQLKEFLPGLPKIVERVSVRGNAIEALPVSARKALNLPNLRMLDLSWNLLEHLPKYGFEGAPQLRVLSLANNRLRSLDDTAFIGVQRLELLHLQDNVLARMDERALLAMPELRNLNVQGNKLETITDNLFANSSRLEQLDLSRNSIRSISPAAFESQRSLEYLDLSGNALADISISLSNLHNVRDVDLSYNQISRVHADVVSAWRNVVEIRLSNNLIVELKHGTFRNLPKLQYLDLSSNEISSVEPSALKHLPDLQEFVLADNKLIELKDHVFEDLPNLLASHFQYNTLRYISPESFYNSPSMVFLNLSNNQFRNMENIGLRSMRNLEVLDLSTNGVKMVSTMPLKALSWLVELKMDNNQICKIQGSPFETMPRLRVLSMRNNRLRTIKERTFRNLRGNIAILDVDGNPIVCSCEMQWLSAWLQETNFPYPGPKCQDGRLLRAARIEKSLCDAYSEGNDLNMQRAGSSDSGANHLPLLNEHGDVFQRELQQELSDECDFFDVPPSGERPLAGESEYFYDQYVDFTPQTNDTTAPTDAPTTTGGQSPPHVDSSNTVFSLHQKKTPPAAVVSANIDLNNTILNTNYFKKRPGSPAGLPSQSTSTSPFTFFGYPLPSLSLGRFFGAAQRGRKDRGEQTSAMPATHRMMHMPPASSTRGKVRMYQPNNAEFEKYLRKSSGGEDLPPPPSPSSQQQHYHDVTARNRYIDAESGSEESTAAGSNESPATSTSSVFKTAFRVPVSVEHGGFRPILPQQLGGFMPISSAAANTQTPRRGVVEAVAATPAAQATKSLQAQNPPQQQSMPHKRANAASSSSSAERNYVPLAATEKRYNPKSPQVAAPPLQYMTPPPPPLFASNEAIETQTYYVTEEFAEQTTAATTPARRITPPQITSTSTVATTATSATTSTSTAPPPLTTLDASDSFDAEFYDDLETQSGGVMLRPPPPLLPITTAETILLIPPPEEHVEQFKRQSWVTTSTPATAAPRRPTTLAPLQRPAADVLATSAGRSRSTITKVYTPQTLNQYLPTAEEFYRTTPTTTSGGGEFVGAASTNDQQLLTANAQKRSEETAAAPASQVDRVDRKGGMDWYYESFKKTHTAPTVGRGKEQQRSGGDFSRHSGALMSSPLTTHLWLVALIVSAWLQSG